MMPSNSETIVFGDPLKSPNPQGEGCSGDEWDCHKVSWVGYVTNSFLRLVTGDFTSLNADIVVAFLFLCLCVVSW